MTEEYSLDDLVRLSGLPLRTVRFYIQEGLLPGPETRGKFAHYSRLHLDRLELIQRLKALRVPLAEIRQLLENMTDDEAALLLRQQNTLRPDLSSFLTADETSERTIQKGPQRKMQADSPTGDKKIAEGTGALEYIQNLQRTWQNIPAAPAAMPSPGPAPIRAGRAAGNRATQWRRIEIMDGVELHIREDQQIAEDDIMRLVEGILRKIK